MPKIPIVERKLSPNTGSPNALVDIRSAGIVGDAIERAGHIGMQIAGQWGERAEKMARQDAENYAINAIAAIDSEYYQKKAEWLSLEGEAAIGKLPEIDKYISEELGKKYLDRKLHPIAQEAIMRHLVNRKAEAQRVMATHEVNQRQAASLKAITNTIEVNRKGAWEGTAGLKEALDNIAKPIGIQVANGTMSKEAAENTLMKGQSMVAESFIEGLVTRDPRTAAGIIKSGVLNQYLTADKLTEFHTKANIIIDRQKNEAAAMGRKGDDDEMSRLYRAIKLNPASVDRQKDILENPKLNYKQMKELDKVWESDNAPGSVEGTAPLEKKLRNKQVQDAFVMIKNMYKKGMFGEDKNKALEEYNAQNKAFVAWSMANPDADPMDYVKMVLEPKELEGIKRILDWVPLVNFQTQFPQERREEIEEGLTKKTVQGKSKNARSFSELPPAHLHKDKSATDTITGKKFISDGVDWIPAKGK